MIRFLRIAGVAGLIIAAGISLDYIMPTLHELAITFSLFAGGMCLWAARLR